MISVIIPTLNEGAYLGKTLHLLAQNRTPHEAIVSDGGSRDETLQIVVQHGAKLFTCPRAGRAVQMNSATSISTGDVLLFLHADTQVRDTSLGQIESAMEDPAVAGGGFTRRFDSASLFLKFTCWLANWRCRTTGYFLGDQAMFVRRAIFDQLHGFKDMDPFEDLDLSQRLVRTGKVVTLSPGVLSSARRFERKGELLTTCSDLLRTCGYFASAISEGPRK